jgi:transcriptional regulator with XRE-family HTH domain
MPIDAMANAPVTDEFIAWLHAEADKRGWSLQYIAQRIGVSDIDFARIAKGQLGPSVDLCEQVALALSIPEEEVFRRAGLLPLDSPSGQREQALWQEAAHLFGQLSPGQRDMLLAFVRAMLIEEQEWNHSVESCSSDSSPK